MDARDTRTGHPKEMILVAMMAISFNANHKVSCIIKEFDVIPAAFATGPLSPINV
jgi:hypothetical protein